MEFKVLEILRIEASAANTHFCATNNELISREQNLMMRETNIKRKTYTLYPV